MSLKKSVRASLESAVVFEHIPQTEQSQMFCSMKKSAGQFNLENYGFCEEEYFIHGTANIYDKDSDGKLSIAHSHLPYTSRIIVRRPLDLSHFSGRVIVDILNATQLSDIEDWWTRSYDYMCENHHAYIGITSKPCNIQSLKAYDPVRYEKLSWETPHFEWNTKASLNFGIEKNTEVGFIWDILSQVGKNLRSGCNLLLGVIPKEIYLTGQSQSGAYLNTYITYFSAFLKHGEKNIFDGYLNVVGNFMCMPLCNKDFPSPTKIQGDVPFIGITSEGDIHMNAANPMMKEMFASTRFQKDGTSKYRLYEVAGAPHSYPQSPVRLEAEEITKANREPSNYDFMNGREFNDLPLRHVIISAMENLSAWHKGIQPPNSIFFELENNDYVLDKNGYFSGGLRLPEIEVPLYKYSPTADHSFNGLTNGAKEKFSLAELYSRYGNYTHYRKSYETILTTLKEMGYICDFSYQKLLSMENW